MFALELLRAASTDGSERFADALAGRFGDGSSVDDETRDAVCAASAALHRPRSFLMRAGLTREGWRTRWRRDPAARRRAPGVRTPTSASAAYEPLLPDDRQRIHTRLAEASTDPVEPGHHVAHPPEGRDRTPPTPRQGCGPGRDAGDHAGAASSFCARPSCRRSGRAAASRGVRAAVGRWTSSPRPAGGAAGRAASGVRERARARRLAVYDRRDQRCPTTKGSASLIALDDAEGRPMLHSRPAPRDRGDPARHVLDSTPRSLMPARGGARERVGANALEVAALAQIGFAESMLGSASPMRPVERWICGTG